MADSTVDVEVSSSTEPSAALTFTTNDGLELHGDLWGPGDGSLVLLLHSGGQSRHAWRMTAANLAQAGYRA